MSKLSPIEIGRYLAREVLYRGLRGESLYTWPRTGTRHEFKSPSAIKANIVGLLYGAMSALLGAPLLLDIPYVSPRAIFVSGILLLTGLCVMFTLMQVTTFTATFVREGVIDLVRLLPIDYRTVFYSYLAALFLYWGALSLVAMFVPFLAMASVAVIRGSIPISMFLAGMFTSFSTLAFSTLVGLALGVTSYITRRRTLLRLASTIGWLLAFCATYAIYEITSFYRVAISYLTKLALGIPQWFGLIPLIGPICAYGSPLYLTISLMTSLAVLYAVYRIAVSKLSAILSGYGIGGALASGPVIKSFETPILRTSTPLIALVKKDLKLLGRESRRLAGVLYSVIFPIIFSLMFMLKGSRGFYLVISCLLGVLSGLSSDDLYFVESSGAKVLYYLPLSKRDIALSKALSTSIITLPPACAAGAIMVFISSGSLLLALISACIVAALNLGTSMFNSALSIRLLPREPSDWSELSTGTSLRRRLARSGIKIAFGILSITIPVLLLLAEPLIGLNKIELVSLIGCYGIITLVVGILLIARLRGDLTS